MPHAMPKTLSSDMMSAACVGGAFFCANTCSVNAVATGNAAPKRIGQRASTIGAHSSSPKNAAKMSDATPVMPS